MQFVNAIWLWGLTSLVIPIGIHLLSRKQGKVIKFGSIRHLHETSTRQFKAIRLNEFVLLALRCLFIVLLVLMLAEPQSNFLKKKNQRVLVESGLEKDPKYTQLIDSLRSIGFEVQRLRDANSGIAHTVEDTKPDYWNALRKVSAGDETVVLSYGYVDGFKGKRIGLPEGVRWLSAEADSSTYNLNTVAISKDTAIIRRGNSTPYKTSFHNVMAAKSLADPSVIQFPDTISILVVFDSFYEYDKDVLLAALQAIKSNGISQLRIEALPISRYVAGKYSWTIWLAQTTPPETRTNLIVMNEKNTFTHSLFFQNTSGGNQRWLLTERLNEEVALREHLTVRLAMILKSEKKYEDRAIVSDRRVLDEKLRWSSLAAKTNEMAPQSDSEIWQYFSIALLLTLAVERLLAFKRDQ
jgi:hypothetical protein